MQSSKEKQGEKEKKSLPQGSMNRNRGKNRMGKTTDLIKKIRDTKGTFHAKMGSIKDRIGNFPGGSDVQSTCNKGDLGSIPGSGRSPGQESGNPRQYSCLENFMEC